MGRGLHTALVRRRAPPPSLVHALLRHAGVGSTCGRDTHGSRRLGALGRAVCWSSRIPPPPPRRGPFWGRGGIPSAPGGRRAAPVAPKLGGGEQGGGGWGGRLPAPSGVCLRSVVSGGPPWGILLPWGLRGGRGRRARSGRPPTGTPLALVRAPVFPGPASHRAALFAPSWAPPVRRWPAAGRACGRLPRLWCPRTLGAGASSGGMRGRRFFGLPPSALGPEWEGGGSGGGPLVPLRRLMTAEGGAAWRSQPRWPAIGWRVAPFPCPPLLRAGPSCKPALGPLVPPSVVARRWPARGGREGLRSAVSGLRGSRLPPHSLSPPSLPGRLARAPLSRRTVGGAWVGGPSSAPHISASAVWAVTCAAACVGAGAVAAVGCAGGSASGRGRCSRPGRASCWRPHP